MVKNLRVGNVVKYLGNIGDARNRNGEIIAIEPLNGEDTFRLRVANWNNEPVELRAYKDEIEWLVITPEMLTSIGFVKVGDRNTYVYNGHYIINPGTVKKIENEHGLHFDDKGWLFVHKPLPEPFTEEQLKESTTSVHFVHFLQNYFTDELGEIIAPEIFLQHNQ